MENLFPIAIAVAATVGLAVYSWSKLNYSKKSASGPIIHMNSSELVFDREKALRDAQPGTVEVALPQRVNAASLMKGDQTSKENLMRSLKKHGFAILEVCLMLRSINPVHARTLSDNFALHSSTIN